MTSLKALLAAAPLGDTRRNDRAFELLATLIAGHPVRASGDAPWAHTMASYRFFDNDAVPLHALYSVAHAAVRERVAPRSRVYIAHDPSVLDYSGHNAKLDRVPIGDHRGMGYELFTSLVLTDAGVPLGPIFQEVRTADGCYSSAPLPAKRRARTAPFVGNIEQMEKAVDAARTLLPDVERVHLADREFDDIALERLIVGGDPDAPNDRFVLRAQHLRRTVTFEGETCRMDAVTDRVRLTRLGTVVHEGTSYRQYVGEATVLFSGKSYRGRHRNVPPTSGPAIPVRVVVVELRARGCETIRWVLLTTLDDALQDVVAAYVFRWKVERYFYLTKVGFKLETWTQQTGERLARRLALSSLAAMVIAQLLTLTADPEAGALIREIVRRGNGRNPSRTPVGPIVLMRGMISLLDLFTGVQQLGVAKIRQLAEFILPGIGQEIREHARAPDV